MPTAIQDLWPRFEAWLAAHAPALRAGLQPPASEARIAAFEGGLAAGPSRSQHESGIGA